MFKRFITAIVLLLTLNACATSQKYDAKLNKLIGKTSEQLQTTMGKPNITKQLKNGDMIYIYTNINDQELPLANFNYDDGIMDEDDIFYSFTYGGNVIPDGNLLEETITDFCQTQFHLKNNIVVSWQWKGNACVAI